MNATSLKVAAFVMVSALVAASLVVVDQSPADAQSYQRISGEGSSWSQNAIDNMRVNVKQFGITVDYTGSGSTTGRRNYLNGIVDFAASDIPFQFEPEDGSPPENPEIGTYAYIPVTAGGTSFIYNLRIGGQPVTNLRLSGENVSLIFTGGITQWNDPRLQADNPGITLPNRPIIPVVRSDGSGSTAQFTQWMINQHPGIWNDYCNSSGRAPACGFTSFYPTISGMISQAGDLGVSSYVTQSFAEGAIGYVNYSYALNVGFPVVKVLNAAGYYTEPTPENVAVSLLQADINRDQSNPATYLTQELDGVYVDQDPRNYPLSSYSYFILPTVEQGQFNAEKGRTLSAFLYYAMCQAQQQSASLGYSPLPINLVEASFDQILLVPGVEAQNIAVESCNNPTFSSDGSNLLAANAPFPQECDRQGDFQCPDGTAGAANVPTAVQNPQVAQDPATGSAGPTPDPASSAAADGGTSTDAATSGVASGGATSSTGSAASGSTGGVVATPSDTTTPSSTGSSGVGGTGTGSSGVTGVGTSGSAGGAVGTGGLDPVTGAPTAVAADGAVAGVATDQAVLGQTAAPALGAAQQAAPATPATLPRSSTSAALVFLIVLLMLAMVIVPVLAWRHLSPGRVA